MIANSRVPVVTLLPRKLRELFEHGLGYGLAGVRLRICPETTGPGVACARSEHIDICRTIYEPDTLAGRSILAHEATHIIQKRLVDRTGKITMLCSRRLLEAEAHAAAHAIVRGQRFDCVCADPSSTARHWSYAGHFYTPYFILRVAGVDDETAQKAAFYAQMPDEVDQLDAKEAGKNIAGAKLAPGIAAAGGGFGGMGGYVPPEVFEWSEEAQRDAHDIQRGLHALTGRDAEEEKKIRAAILKEQTLGSQEFGLALHAFGDSFAHQDIKRPGRMYDPGWGHARDGTKADAIDQRADLYIRYALGMYDIVVEMTPATTNRPLDKFGKDKAERQAKLTEFLKEVTKQKGNEAQKKKLIEIAHREFGLKLTTYDPKGREPQSECVDAKKFAAKYPKLVSEDDLKKAAATGKSWSWRKLAK